jgi:hypothetical protein
MTPHHRFSPLLGLSLALACTPSAPPPQTPPPAALIAPPAALIAPPAADPHRAALGHDPEAQDEAVRQALHDLRDKFLCNSVSGCKAEAVLVDAGWAIRPTLEQVFLQAPAQASWRARTVRILARLRDPDALPFLLGQLDDREPEVQAYAIWGLGLLDARQGRARLTRIARDEATLWLASPKLSALWVLHRWGETWAGDGFVRYLRQLSQQQMAAVALTWGAELCADPRAPDCDGVLPALARHPGFLARRQAVRAMAQQPARGQEAVLIEVAGDHVRSSAELAEDALRRLTGQQLHGAEAWRQWCAQVDCRSWEPK